jgi:hypothetical protein
VRRTNATEGREDSKEGKNEGRTVGKEGRLSRKGRKE